MRYRVVALVLFTLCVSCTAETTAPTVALEDEGPLAAQALVEACRGRCSGVDIFVRVHLGTIDGLAGPMPETIRQAIGERFPSVAMVDEATADKIFSEDDDPENRHSVLITIGPLVELAEGVIGFPVSLSDSYYSISGWMQQFRWDGTEWIPATQDDTGITVTTWVS